MPDFDTARFSSPVPGMSLTTEPGSRPWEKPAKYPHAEDALGFYMQELSAPERLNSLFDILERNFPVTTLVDSIVVSGVMEGLHSLDTAIIISAPIFQYITGVADIAGIEYRTGTEHDGKDSPTLITAAIKEAQSQENIEEQDEEVNELMEIAEEGIAQAETGLMSRPSIEMGEE
mgnify:FL=1